MRSLETLAALALFAAASALGGCGGVYYTYEVQAATTRVESARSMGAEKKAPYEYYYAIEHLHQAQIEAAEASYGDAAQYAETAETFAQRAIDIIKGKTPAAVNDEGVEIEKKDEPENIGHQKPDESKPDKRSNSVKTKPDEDDE